MCTASAQHPSSPRLVLSATCPLRDLSSPRLVLSATCPLRDLSSPRLVLSATCPLRDLSSPRLVLSATCPLRDLSCSSTVIFYSNFSKIFPCFAICISMRNVHFLFRLSFSQSVACWNAPLSLAFPSMFRGTQAHTYQKERWYLLVHAKHWRFSHDDWQFRLDPNYG